MNKGINKYNSPGAMLKGELKKRKMTQKQFAEAICLMPSHVSEIASNKRSISLPVATKLQSFFDIPAKEWLDLQTRFKLSETEDAKEFKAAETLMEYDEFVSIKTLFSRIIGTKIVNSREKLIILKNEYGINSIQNLQSWLGFFKKSEKTGLDVRMLNTWTFLARRESHQCGVTGQFDRNDLYRIGNELSCVFHANENTVLKTANVLSNHGIKFCIVKKVDHASIDGFSFLEKGIPTIAVTKRFDRIDNFAFTVLHELYHVCKHLNEEGDQCVSIEGYSSENQKEEKEANYFAANTLIPENIWKDAPEVKPIPRIIQNVYTKWAKSNGLNKWIVLGRIAHDLGMYQMSVDDSRNIN